MIYQVEILPTAWEDLKRMEDWYLMQFGVETALKVSDHILDAIERLEHFPNSGSLTPDEWINLLIRRRNIRNYFNPLESLEHRRFLCGFYLHCFRQFLRR